MTEAGVCYPRMAVDMPSGQKPQPINNNESRSQIFRQTHVTTWKQLDTALVLPTAATQTEPNRDFSERMSQCHWTQDPKLTDDHVLAHF